MPLRFGPYILPRLKPGQRADCEYAGTVRVVAISDAPQQWPLGIVWGHRIPVLCGELVRAVRSESAGDVAAAWGVGSGLVSKWRKALRVKRTKGEHLRRSENIKASDPSRARKIAKAKLGKPRPPHVIEAMRQSHLGKPLSKAMRAKLSAVRKRLGIRPPWLKPAWSPREDRIVRSKSPAEAARLTGRSYGAVFARRRILGVSRLWTPKLDRIVQTKSPRMAAKLTGKSLQAIYTRRSILGVNDGPAKRYKRK